MTEKNWEQLTPEEKKAKRFEQWLNPQNVEFVSPEAEKSYKIRAQRYIDVYNLKEPDRVPVNLLVGNLPLTLYGASMHTAMYDYPEAVECFRKFNEQYSEDLDFYAGPRILPGNVFDLLDYKLYVWPGHGLSSDAPGFQFLEGEYMKADEYNDLIRDPSDFWFRTYFPRVFGAFAPFRMFQPMTDYVEISASMQLIPLASPEMQDCLQKLLETGRELQKMTKITAQHVNKGKSLGFPGTLPLMFTTAPFDTLGDTLRGTTNIMMDLYRRPDEVLEACDKLADLKINSILKSPRIKDIAAISYPLHKGADGWLSQKQFETFYWPSLKKVMDAFIKEGLVQSMFAEGSYNTRLEYFKEFPKGSVSILFDQTDIFRAKRELGNNCCIRGNIPASLVATASPEEIKEHCRKLIEVCGKGGGYVLAAGCVPDNPKIENLRAIMDAVREYGFYK